jgi:hypothetical protein
MLTNFPGSQRRTKVHRSITYLQWHDLRHNFEVDQRAWLKVDVALPLQIKPDTTATVTVSNVGKSPALRIVVDMMFEVVKNGSAPNFVPVAHRTMANVPLMFPTEKGQPIVVPPTPNHDDGSPRDLTQDEINGLSTGTMYIAVLGMASYIDPFGTHWTRFCNWKPYQMGQASFNANSCVVWNAVGDGEAPPPDKQPK